MSHEPITVEQLRTLINRGEAKDPLVFLEAVMNGQDPRRLSSIYELVMEIQSFTDGNLSKDDWNEVVDHVISRYKYHTVSMNESLSASKTLAEYLHAKKKQVETLDSSRGSGHAADAPLTEEEIELFKERFNDEF